MRRRTPSCSGSISCRTTGSATRNLTVGVVDEDQSDLSRQIVSALNPPLVKSVVALTPAEIDPAMDTAG